MAGFSGREARRRTARMGRSLAEGRAEGKRAFEKADKDDAEEGDWHRCPQRRKRYFFFQTAKSFTVLPFLTRFLTDFLFL